MEQVHPSVERRPFGRTKGVEPRSCVVISSAFDSNVFVSTAQCHPTQSKPLTIFAGVADVPAALAKAVVLGATIVQAATKAPGVTFGLFADPQGHVVGVASNDENG
jgi:predicted enzyme related to lactoylglutathione lyase